MLIQFHIQTIFMMIILTCLTLALSVGWVAWKDDVDGLRTWAVALCVHALAYSLLSERGVIPDFFSVVVANTLISISYSIFLVAVLIFLDSAIHKMQLWIPPLMVAGSFLLMLDNIYGRIIVGNAIYFIQGIIVCRYAASYKNSSHVRGRNLMLLGLSIAMLVTLSRVVAAIFSPGDVEALFKASSAQVATYFAVFMSIILVSNGFVLMAKERSDEHLRTVAMKDKLTDCWNRIRIEEIAEQEMARLKRYGYPASLVMIDLDHFKRINDQYGHAVGDTILREFGRIARESVRSTDVVGRWGGEEFVVVLPSSGFSEAAHVAEKIRLRLEENVFPGGYRATASFGVAVCRSTDVWPDWLGRADNALYRAKAAGRNQTKVEDLEIGENNLADGSVRITQLLWRKSYESGNETIDSQHKVLFEMVNDLLMVGIESVDKVYVLQAALQLLDEVKRHFRDEEKILGDLGYALADEHAKNHAYMLARANDLVARLMQDKLGVPELFHFIIYELTTQHMLIEDRKFYPLFIRWA